MVDYIDVQKTTEELIGYADQVERDAIEAARMTIKVVKANVLDLTPRYTGKLQSEIYDREEDGGRTQVVYTDSVVGRVMEGNPPAHWSKWPPFKPIFEWAQRKLGLDDKAAKRAAFAIRRKLLVFGMQLPLKHDGRGKMFARTWEKMQQTKFHWATFTSALRRLARLKTTDHRRFL